MPRGSVSGQTLITGAEETKGPRREDGTWKFWMLMTNSTPWTDVSTRSATVCVRPLEAADAYRAR